MWVDYLVIALGAIIAVLGFTGVLGKTRKGQRMTRLLGELGVRIFYTVLGIVLIVVTLIY